MMKKSFTLSTAIAASLMTAAIGAVTVTNDTALTTTVDSGADQTNKTTTYSSWSLNGGNTVAVFFSGEGQDLTSATFGGETMTIVHATSGGRWSAAIAYLINPSASSGDIVLSWADAVNGNGGQNEIGYTPFALGGVGGVAGFAANDDGANLNFNYTISGDGGYILGAATNNQFDGTPVPTVTSNPDIFEYSGAISGNFATIHVHGDLVGAGDYSDTISGDLESAVFVAFNPVPEPSTLLLGSLGALLLLRRRRC